MTLPEFAKHDDTLIQEVWIKKANPQRPFHSWEELFAAHPECSVDNEGDDWICMNESDWEIWMHTGVMPQVIGIV